MGNRRMGGGLSLQGGTPVGRGESTAERGKSLQEKDPLLRIFLKESTFRNLLILIMVGTGRFELPTPRTPSECSTRLSHVPTSQKKAAERNQRLGFSYSTRPSAW